MGGQETRVARAALLLALYVALTSVLGLLVLALDGVLRGVGPHEVLAAMWWASPAADLVFITGVTAAGAAAHRLAAGGRPGWSIMAGFLLAWATFGTSVLLLPRGPLGLNAVLPAEGAPRVAAALRLALSFGSPGLLFAALAPLGYHTLGAGGAAEPRRHAREHE